MLATPRFWSLSVVPIIWSAIGGSAAFLLGVYADVALPLAGIALVMFLARNSARQNLLRPGRTCGPQDHSADLLDGKWRVLRDN
jgi:hypothetical protein